jgi:hypothetical protein
MRASESMQRKQAENLEKGCLSVKPWREKGNHEWDKLIKELFLTLTPPKKGIFWGKRQAKKQRLARFFEKSVVENVRHFVFINGYLSFFVCNNQAESFVNRGF